MGTAAWPVINSSSIMKKIRKMKNINQCKHHHRESTESGQMLIWQISKFILNQKLIAWSDKSCPTKCYNAMVASANIR